MQQVWILSPLFVDLSTNKFGLRIIKERSKSHQDRKQKMQYYSPATHAQHRREGTGIREGGQAGVA